jgi:hypothetical protein
MASIARNQSQRKADASLISLSDQPVIWFSR